MPHGLRSFHRKLAQPFAARGARPGAGSRRGQWAESRRIIRSSTRVIATEFDEDTIGLAKPRSAAHIRLASADIEHLAFPDNTFDAVTATLVFCSVERPIVGFQEVRRVLKPGGRLHLIEHVRSHHHWLARWQDKLNARWMVWAEGCNLNRDTEANLRAAQFEIETLRVNYYGLIKTMVARKATT